MKQYFLYILLMMYTIGVKAQHVHVYNAENKNALENVFISDIKSLVNTITDKYGRADIAPFASSTSISFSLIGYKSVNYSFDELFQMKFQIALEVESLELEQVVVSASRWNQSSRDIPSKIISLNPSDFAFNNPQTAADLLGHSGKVFIQKSQQGGGSPMIRGFSANRLIYAVDGVRMNTAIFRSGNIQNVISLDAFATESAEVLFGPGSVIYGSDAIGGVMAFQTLTPRLSTNTGQTIVSGKAVARYSTANEEKTGHFDINFGGQKLASVTSVSYNNFGDLRMGSNGPDDYLKLFIVERQGDHDVSLSNPDSLVQAPSGYSQYNITQKIRFQLNDDWDIQYGLHISESSKNPRYDRHLRLRNGLPRYGEFDYGPQTWSMNHLKITHREKSGLYDQGTLRLAFQKFGESRIDRDLNELDRQIQTESVDAWSVNLDLIKSYPDHKKLLYGLEFVTNDVTSTGSYQNSVTGKSKDGPSRYPMATWSSYGAYINYQQTLSEQWSIHTGLRYNQIALHAIYDTTFFPLPFTESSINQGAFTGSLGIVFRPQTSLSVHANLATGFRAPNVDDTGKVFDSAVRTVTIPNKEIKAEFAYNAELGFIKVFGDRIKIDLTGYYTLLKNAMVRRPFTLNGQDSINYKGELSQVLAVQNAAEAVVYGIQAGINIKLFAGLSFRSDYNVQVGEEELDNKSISPSRHAAPAFGMSVITFQKGKWHIELNSQYSTGRTFKELPAEEQGKPELYAKDSENKPFSPSWQIYTIRTQYQFNNKLSATLAVENLTDQRYRPYSSGLAGPGRNALVSALVKF
ncbi:MAG: TonB-dependent receptor [Saprospiraceae bacterium]|nr:TonB-dependent receptor [Saprospiraceae bacterium]